MNHVDIQHRIQQQVDATDLRHKRERDMLRERHRNERGKLLEEHIAERRELNASHLKLWEDYRTTKATTATATTRRNNTQAKIQAVIENLRIDHGFTASNQHDIAEQLIGKLSDMQKMYRHLPTSASGLSSDQRAILRTEKIFRRSFAIIMGPESLAQLPLVSKAPEQDIDALLRKADDDGR